MAMSKVKMLVLVSAAMTLAAASEPLVSTISRQFDINVNIIFGNVELIGQEPIGGLVSILSGRPEDIEGALNYLRDKNVGVEVILDARVS